MIKDILISEIRKTIKPDPETGEKEIKLAQLKKGEIFGELSFFDKRPRSAGVRTTMPSEFFIVDRDSMNLLSEKNKDIAIKILSDIKLEYS